MALPLPQVVSDTGPGGGVVTAMRGMNALTQSNLDNQIKGVQAQYAPYTTYADAASKLAYANMLPYQVQATVMSNPMMWMALKDNPEAIKSMMNNFQQSIPQGNNLFGGIQIPQPGQQNSNSLGSGLLNMLYNKLSGGVQSTASPQDLTPNQTQSGNVFTNNINPPAQGGNSSNNALVPAASGGTQGIFGKMTSPYQESPYKPGIPFVDPQSGQVVSAPSLKTVAAVQQQLLGAKRVEPQLDRLAEEWSPFMNLKGMAKLQGARVGNMLSGMVSPESLKQFGLSENSTLPSDYAKAKSTTLTVPESLVKAYGLNATNETLETLRNAIEPLWGETRQSYKNRIKTTLQQLKQEQISPSQQMLGGGFNLSSQPDQLQSNSSQVLKNSPEAHNEGLAQVKLTPRQDIKQNAELFKNQIIKMQAPDGKIWNVPQGKAQKFLDNYFKRVG